MAKVSTAEVVEFSSMNANPSVANAMKRVAELNRQAKAIAIEKKELIDGVKEYMGDIDDLYNWEGTKLLATNREVTTTRFDAVALREKHPRIAGQFTYTGFTRKFLIK